MFRRCLGWSYIRAMEEVIISLGSNMGDRLGQLQLAIKKSAARLGKLMKVSPVYETPPWGFEDPRPFLNQVFSVHSALSADQCMQALLDIETEMGRVRHHGAYAARSIDLDILFYGHQCIETAHIHVPHPHLAKRNFVLVPLADIYPDWCDPLTGKSIQQLLAESPDRSAVEAYVGE